MVLFIGSMFATAFAMSVLPWFISIPLFILTQIVLWSVVVIGLFRRVLRFVFRNVHIGSQQPSQTQFFCYNPTWEKYKKQYLS